MKKFSSETTIAFGNLSESRAISCSGNVIVSVKNGDSFDLSDTLTTGAYEIFTKGMIIKFTPDAGVEFSIYGDDL